MLVSATTLLLAAATLALSAPVNPTANSTEPYKWKITGWSAGCSRSGCYYDFNITSPEFYDGFHVLPAFDAYCSGDQNSSTVENFRPCKYLSSPPAAANLSASFIKTWGPNAGISPRILAVTFAYGAEM